MDKFWDGKITKHDMSGMGRKFFRYDIDVTDIVRSIMGDGVVSARMELHENNCDDDVRLEEILAAMLEEYQEYGFFCCDCSDVIITFKNGRTVMFDSGECGSMKRLDNT